MRTNASSDPKWRLVFDDHSGDGVGFGCNLKFRGETWIVTGASKERDEVYLSRDNAHAVEKPANLQLSWERA